MILGGHHGLAPLSDQTYRKIARDHDTYLLEDLWEEPRPRRRGRYLPARVRETSGAIERIKHGAVKKVRNGGSY